jgi:deoxycytidylate deaminase
LPTDVGFVRANELEYQNFVLDEVLHRMNGPALRQTRDQGGFGTHEFEFDAEGVDYSQVDLQRPIVAYHPLYLYEAGSLQTVNLGHVSDIHINARQKLLAKSPARVIDAESGTAESPVIGSMMNTFERSFLSILDAIDNTGVDVLLVGGDLIEHVDNAFPYHDGTTAEKLRFPSAAAVWDLVDVDNNYDRNYQSFVDYIAFFTAIRHFCSSKIKPAFAVTGNHDCYKNTQIYGISPRLFFGIRKANEGIPADHNLTFYEAMLAFGESWGSAAMKDPFDAQYHEWFYAVLTPFSDFNVQLPKVALVGLAPKCGGGAYESGDLPDHRCFADPGERDKPYCRNEIFKREIYREVFDSLISAELLVKNPDPKEVQKAVEKTRIRDLIEFSRAVHAEMDALLSLGRIGGLSSTNCSLYCTTFPCHSCAKHIVAAGIKEVVYIEPYQKSLAQQLHGDAIEVSALPTKTNTVERVRFHLFSGVAPRRFASVFEAQARLKDKDGNLSTEVVTVAQRHSLLQKSYLDLENEIVQLVENLRGSEAGDAA